ncbi:hypothetical protein EDF36_3304 [Rathayibacter sp. PhB152]|nr:hypothetical protein EDF36_3304 [Rathayibacter sp. PhB152]
MGRSLRLAQRMAESDRVFAWLGLGSEFRSVRVVGAKSDVLLNFDELVRPFWTEIRSNSSLIHLAQIEVRQSATVTSSIARTVIRGHATLWVPITADRTSVALALLSFIRALAKADAESRVGGVNVHAGCVARGGSGLLLSGERGAGKTTLILRAMKRGLSFVSNDQTMLVRDSSGLRGFGYPALVAVRDKSALKDFSKFSPVRSFMSVDGDADGVRREFSISDICRRYNVNCEVSATISTLVLYAQDANLALPRVEQADPHHWVSTSRLPLIETYAPSLVEDVRQVLGLKVIEEQRFSLPPHLKVFNVTAPIGQIDEVVQILKELV